MYVWDSEYMYYASFMCEGIAMKLDKPNVC